MAQPSPSRTHGLGAPAAPRAGLLVLALSMAGCSATQSFLRCQEAQRAVRSAEQLPPAQQDLYELTRARAYLDKAREEASEAHYEVAIQLAQNAERAAERVLQTRSSRGQL